MKKPHIIFIDDQPDVLSSLRNDLRIFREKFTLDDCESAQEAEEILEELEASGTSTALILCDHIMPDKNGIDFLSEISRDERFETTRKILITGQASHNDTINAINNAAIDYYISKPWSAKELHTTIKTMITHWILDNNLDYQSYKGLIDPELLLNHIKKEGGTKS